MTQTQLREISIRPIINYPRHAEPGKSYLMTVDVEPVLEESGWPYEREEYTIFCEVDGGNLFDVLPIGESSIVLHRFGGSYGYSSFLLTASTAETVGKIEVTFINGWGIPLDEIHLEEIEIATIDTQQEAADFVTPPSLFIPHVPPDEGVPTDEPLAQDEDIRQHILSPQFDLRYQKTDIFCPNCNTLILDAPRCKCGWERPPTKATERGKLAWKISLAGGRVTNSTREPSGLRLADGVLYLVDGAGNLRALDAGSGKDKWPAPPSLGEWRVHNQVAVGGGLVVVGPVDNASIPSADKAVMAFDAETGQERWRRRLDVRQISDPLISQDAVFVATSDGYGVALNLGDGSVRWREPIGGIYFAAPALAADLVLFGSDKGILMARRSDDGKEAWRFEAEDYGRWSNEFRYPATVVDGVAYVTCWNRRCYALDAASGKEQWRSEPTEKRPPMTPPLVADDAIFFAAHDCYIYCLDRESGERRWAKQLPKYAQVSPALIDNVLYIAAGDRNVYALDPATGEQMGDPVLQTAGKIEHAWACDGHTLTMADSKGRLYGLTVRTPEVVTDAAMLEKQGQWQAAAAQHALAGDLLRAAEIYQRELKDSKKAAQLFEAADELLKAAQAYEAAQQVKEALGLYQGLEQWDRVAKISYDLGNLLTAAQAYERDNQWGRAGYCYFELKNWSQAAIAYEKAADVADGRGDRARAADAWTWAAQVYVHLKQPAKAAELLLQAGKRQQAEKLLKEMRADMSWTDAIALKVNRVIYDPQTFAGILAQEGQHRLAAEEYLRAKDPLNAAKMYEQAKEYRLAAEQYSEAGQQDKAARMMEKMGDWDAAGDLYKQAGMTSAAATAFSQAGDRRGAAEMFESAERWAEAAEQWSLLELWERAALAWENAGEILRAADAWKKDGDLLRAAENFWQVGREYERSENVNTITTAQTFEHAMLLFRDCGMVQRAEDCDRRRRYFRRQPLLKVDTLKIDDFVEEKWGKLTVVVQNLGWGLARDISISAEGHFETDQKQVPQAFGLVPDLPGESSWYIKPENAGTVPLHLTIVYTDNKGEQMPQITHKLEIPVRDKGDSKSSTPAEYHIHGNIFQVESAHDVMTGDQVKIQRQSATPPAEPTIAPKDEAPIPPTITCDICGEEQPASAFKCSKCQVPFVKEAGQLDKTVRMMEKMGDLDAAGDFYKQAGMTDAAATTSSQAGDRRAAAEMFEAEESWSQAAKQWELLELWERAALAWEKDGELVRAAENFWQAAREYERTMTVSTITIAQLFEQAMQLFRDCGMVKRAVDCDHRCRYIRRQPLLKVDTLKIDDFVEDRWGKLTVVVQNLGWGLARNISISAEGNFETDHKQVPQAFDLAPDLPGESSWYIKPDSAGLVPLHFNIEYTDAKGDSMPQITHTLEIPVRGKEDSKSSTPAEYHVHGNVIPVESAPDVVTGDQVKIQRQSTTQPVEPTVPTIICDNCGEEQPATAFKCSNCQIPFVN